MMKPWDLKMEKYKSSILWSLIAIKFIIQYFLIHPTFELHRDEFLHLDLGKHLAWGYSSVPPATSWISLLILALGNGVFWVKLFPALFGALTLVVVWKITAALHGGIYACFLAAMAVTFSAVFRLNTLYQPNSLDVLCWTLLFYTLIRYVQTVKNRWLFEMTLVFALGFLNKYSIVFLVCGLLAALLLSSHRGLFFKRPFFISCLLALILISPNLFWQYQHDFPVFKHLKELTDTQLVNVKRMDFLKDQLFFFFPGLLVALAGIISFFSYAPFKKYSFVLLSVVITLSLYTYLRAKSYYAIGLYPVLLSFGAAYLEKLTHNGIRYYLRPVLIIMIPLLFIPYLKIGFPIYSPQEMISRRDSYSKIGQLRWEDGKIHDLPQDYADMLGWKELAEKVDAIYEAVPDREHTLIICDNYGEAGAINYYSKHKDINALSLNADYRNWFNLSKEIQQVIVIKTAQDDDLENKEESFLFHRIERKGIIENQYAREKGTMIFLMSEPKVSINELLKNNIINGED